MSARDELLQAVDAVEAAVVSGDARRVERRLRDLRASVVLHVPAVEARTMFVCDVCGVKRATEQAYRDHRDLVHGLPS
ncbi:MAG TPA: hypothetical protein VGH82_17235 [Gaiellaceae bacterium]